MCPSYKSNQPTISPQSSHKSSHNPPTILPASVRVGWGSGLPFGNAPNPMPPLPSSWRCVSAWVRGALSGMPRAPSRPPAPFRVLNRSATHNHTRSHPLSHTHQPTATAHRPTEPHTSTHSHCTSTHRATHILPQPLHINPPSHALSPHSLCTSTHRATHILVQATAHAPRRRASLCLPAMQPYERAAQPVGALPPCNATLRARRAAARRFASLQCLALARPPPSAASV